MYCVNPYGHVFPVTLDRFQALVADQPHIVDEKGKVLKAGFRAATEKDIADAEEKSRVANLKLMQDDADLQMRNQPKVIIQQVVQSAPTKSKPSKQAD